VTSFDGRTNVIVEWLNKLSLFSLLSVFFVLNFIGADLIQSVNAAVICIYIYFTFHH